VRRVGCLHTKRPDRTLGRQTSLRAAFFNLSLATWRQSDAPSFRDVGTRAKMRNLSQDVVETCCHIKQPSILPPSAHIPY